MKRRLLLAAIIVALVGLCLVWWSGRDGVTAPERVVTDAQPEPRGAASLLADVPEATPERSALRAIDIGGEAQTPLVTPPAAQHGFEVMVVDALSQSPVPGAEVFVADAPDSATIDDRDRLWLHTNALIASLEADGKRFTADEHGHAMLPELRPRTAVFAQQGDRRGIVRINADATSPMLLELHRDFDVAVQVVDAGGVALAGIPVALSFGNDWIQREGARAITAGPQGLATLRHVGLSLAIGDDQRGFAALAGLFDPPVRVAIDPRDPPSGPVMLVAPPSGELEVVLRRRDGTLDPENAQLRLEIVRRSPAAGDEDYSVAWLGPMHEGRVVIPRVMLQSRFRAGVFRDGTSLHASAQADGPTLPGERTTFAIDTEVDARGPVIAARLLDERGQPLASIPILVGTSAGEPPKSPGFQNVTTDRSGRFRVGAFERPDTPPATDVLIARSDAGQRNVTTAFARVPLRSTLRPGVTDLGDVVLTRGPLIVGGRVLDPQGQPVAGARVSLAPTGAWWGFWPFGIQGRSDDAGRFEVRGLSWAEKFSAFATVDGAVSPRTAFEHGAADVTLVVVRTGEIAGVILLKPPLTVRDVVTSAQLEDDDTAPVHGRTVEANGALRFRDLPAGRYRITLYLQEESSAVGEFKGLQVVDGETLRPPELNPLDLTTRIHLHELTARDPEGRSITGLDVSWRPAGQQPNEDDDGHDYVNNGRARIVSRYERIDADIASNGLRTAHVKDLTGEREIMMERAVRVRLKLKADAPLPDAPFTLAPILAPAPGSLDPSDWWAAAFTSAREAIFDASESGRREVHFIVYKAGHSRPEAVIKPAVPQFITIADEPAEQVFEVTITQEELQRGISVYPR